MTVQASRSNRESQPFLVQVRFQVIGRSASQQRGAGVCIDYGHLPVRR